MFHPAQKQRMNFEALFQRYESGVLRHTENLLSKIAVNDGNVGAEIVNLFAAKILNFARNPFSIPKILNTGVRRKTWTGFMPHPLEGKFRPAPTL